MSVRVSDPQVVRLLMQFNGRISLHDANDPATMIVAFEEEFTPVMQHGKPVDKVKRTIYEIYHDKVDPHEVTRPQGIWRINPRVLWPKQG